MKLPIRKLLQTLAALPLCAAMTVPAIQNAAAQPGSASLGTLEDFDALPVGPFQKGFLESWRWGEEKRSQAPDWSSLEVVPAPEGGGKVLRIRIQDPRALADAPNSIIRLTPFFPPEADALRIRLMVLSGQASIYIGGPTAYYANSDVFTEPQTLKAAAKPEWVEVTCNFNHPTWRNFRRAGFSNDAPRNYYSRWAQEAVGVFLGADSKGEFLIDRIDLVAMGEGGRFPPSPRLRFSRSGPSPTSRTAGSNKRSPATCRPQSRNGSSNRGNARSRSALSRWHFQSSMLASKAGARCSAGAGQPRKCIAPASGLRELRWPMPSKPPFAWTRPKSGTH